MTAAIAPPYGNDLATMAERISGVIAAIFVDADGVVLACSNAQTNKPFVDDDWQIRDLEAHATWYARGSFPFALKRTAMHYEDADMTTGELLMAFLARARAVPTITTVPSCFSIHTARLAKLLPSSGDSSVITALAVTVSLGQTMLANLMSSLPPSNQPLPK